MNIVLWAVGLFILIAAPFVLAIYMDKHGSSGWED